MNTPLLVATDIGHDYSTPAGIVQVLEGVDLTADRGELVVVHGASGSGKSTLLQILGGLLQPNRGGVIFDGVPLGRRSDDDLLMMRRDQVSFVFQDFQLLPELTAAENVEVPLRILRVPSRERDARVREVLASVGLEKHAAQRPDELSGGQQQRVGVARAIVARPALLLADEPTAQLDSATSSEIIDLIAELVEKTGLSAVVTSSDDTLRARADRIYELPDR